MGFDYRKYYKDYYGIDFGSEYDIHHIDFNHGNNDINNLILLPEYLHKEYHELVGSIEFLLEGGFTTKIDINNGQTLYYEEMQRFCEVMIEINKWKLKKVMLNMKIVNQPA